MKNKTGFTLIELVIVVAIVAIISSVVYGKIYPPVTDKIVHSK